MSTEKIKEGQCKVTESFIFHHKKAKTHMCTSFLPMWNVIELYLYQIFFFIIDASSFHFCLLSTENIVKKLPVFLLYVH